MTARAFIAGALWFSVLSAGVPPSNNPPNNPVTSVDEPNAAALPRRSDAFFAGAVTESSSEKLTVTRTVLGKSENRTFAVTADTKIEGQLAQGIRVTVRYTTDEYGDTATMVVVRPATNPPPRAKKK